MAPLIFTRTVLPSTSAISRARRPSSLAAREHLHSWASFSCSAFSRYMCVKSFQSPRLNVGLGGLRNSNRGSGLPWWLCNSDEFRNPSPRRQGCIVGDVRSFRVCSGSALKLTAAYMYRYRESRAGVIGLALAMAILASRLPSRSRLPSSLRARHRVPRTTRDCGYHLAWHCKPGT